MRHGRTEWNREERFRGRADIALDETGLKQAAAAALSLQNREAVAIYSSPLRRALQTADIIAKQLKLTVELMEGLNDIDFGSWQGLSGGEAAKQDSRLFQMWLEQPHLVHFPGGQSLDTVRQNVLAALDELAARHDKQTVILVSHKVVCQVLMCAMLGLDNSHFWHVRQDLNAINVFEMRDEVPLVTLVNDTCHLKNLSAG